ncbi:superoxide dismutase [Labrys sp. KNU-23]|uniref:superoxide dismutase n=1 Tax=Labrys sp. KNU-23 TaxID=2789216 RepID=UPI001FEDA38A|nr:superoxide dismutase [Labrys sp. KNU-23]
MTKTMLNRRTLLAAATGAALAASAKLAPASAAAAASTDPKGPAELPPLPYEAASLAPTIDAETMTLHHDKHHQAYVSNFNAALKQEPSLAGLTYPDILAGLDKVPQGVRQAVRNNLGGHVNHSMFWQIMGAKGGEPEGEVLAAIERDFGGVAKLQEAFGAAGAKVFGSGWVFVTVTSEGKLALDSKPNQDTPLMDGKRALFGNDVWEHAYYLTYRNRRPDYLKAWWQVVDWRRIGERYALARQGKLVI